MGRRLASIAARGPVRSESGALPFVLLSCVVGFLMLAPFLPTDLIGRVTVQGMVTTLILVTAVLRHGRRALVAVASLTVLWVVASWSVVLLRPPHWVELGAHGLLVVLLALALHATLRPVFTARKVNAATIAGAISGYLLIAIAWAAVYLEFAAFDPNAFSPALNSQTWVEAVYFSLVTITTVGYGDIVAQNPVIRIWSGLEAVMGNLYMAVLIARLVSDWRDERRAR